MQLNCKVIKKWQPPISTSTPPFQGYPTFLKIFGIPLSDLIFGRYYPTPLRFSKVSQDSLLFNKRSDNGMIFVGNMAKWKIKLIKGKEIKINGSKKTKHAKFSEKRTFLTPWYAHVQGVMVKKGLKWAINPLSQSRFDWLCLMIINMKMQLFVA